MKRRECYVFIECIRILVPVSTELHSDIQAIYVYRCHRRNFISFRSKFYTIPESYGWEWARKGKENRFFT